MDRASTLVLVGPMGAGKSVAGPRLAARLGLPFVDLDAAVERDSGTTVGALFEREGEAAFREREHRLLDDLLDRGPCVLATGGGAVLDIRNRALLRERACVAWLRAGVDAQLQRLAGCRDRPLLQGADPEATLHRLAVEREPLYREVADVVIDTGGRDVEAVVDALAEAFRDRHEPAPTQ